MGDTPFVPSIESTIEAFLRMPRYDDPASIQAEVLRKIKEEGIEMDAFYGSCLPLLYRLGCPIPSADIFRCVLTDPAIVEEDARRVIEILEITNSVANYAREIEAVLAKFPNLRES